MPVNAMFRRLLLRVFQKPASTPIRGRRGSIRQVLEELEERTVPTVFQPTYILESPAGSGNGNSPIQGIPDFVPSQFDQAYGVNYLNGVSGSGIMDGGVLQQGLGETIAIVDAYDDPKMVSSTSSSFSTSDLHVFDQQYGLPEPTGFFTKVNQNGVQGSYPSGSTGWGGEISLDVEWAHAIAPYAHIILVEANSATNSNLLNAAAEWAGNSSGAEVVTMSFGGGESTGETSYDSDFTATGVTYFASTGDSSAPAGYPAYSPNVVAVGGTSLTTTGNGNYSTESVWGDGTAGDEGGGGGISTVESAPSYQSGLVIHSGSSVVNQNGKRSAPDVSIDADPNTGVSIYDSYGSSGWQGVGGTSLASPVWAALTAITDEIRSNHGLSPLTGSSQTLPKLYSFYNNSTEYAAYFHDVKTGSNGYSAATGYDLGSGIGTPIANALMPALALSGSISVTSNTSDLVFTPSSITISGVGFDPNKTYDTVTFNDGAVGTVTAATTTSLTVTFTTAPTAVGGLTAVVTADGFSSGSAIQVATIVPGVTLNSTDLPASATSITINGVGFDSNHNNDAVTFNNGAVGSVTAASATSLTVTFSTKPTVGNLTAVVTVDGVSSGSPVQVATVTPVVTLNSATLPINASTITIDGFGFDTNIANDSVVFGDSAVGTVAAATANTLTVTLTTPPSALGTLTASVTIDTFSSGSQVQVATVIPFVTQSTAALAFNGTGITINGFGFDANANNDSVTFNDGAVGTVSAATPTTLVVTFTTPPTSVGNLTAVVATDTYSSGSAVQVATVVPVVTPNTTTLAIDSPSLTIEGFGFDANANNDTVTFNDGAVGHVTAATATALTVSFTTLPVAVGTLTASVTSDTFTGSTVQVATVIPVVTPSTATIPVTASSLTIAGFGFDTTPGNNAVAFNDGAIGTVTAATATALTVTFSTDPLTAGILTATVTTDNVPNGSAVQVATVAPVVTAATTLISPTTTTLTIDGFGFDSLNANNSVALNLGAAGTVTTSTPTQLVVTFTTPPSQGNLTATVTSDSVSSGAATPVAVVTSVAIYANTASLAQDAPQVIITGFGFSTTLANNTVTFSDGAAGTVIAATPTQLTVALTAQPTGLGVLNATVSVSSVGSWGPTQVATIVPSPTVTSSSASLPITATSITIAGTGFSTTLADDSVVFNDGVVGTITAATATALTVSITTPSAVGNLTAVVTSNDGNSGSPVLVATVKPVVTSNTTTLPANATSLTIEGFGFDTTAGNNIVAFNDGAVGTVTAASPTSLTVTFSTKPTTAGNLTAAVTTDSQSIAAVPVATVIPVITSNTANLPASASSMTISGFGFDPTASHDAVAFDDGAVGTVTSATATALTVSFSTKPTTAGSLTATITTDSESNGPAVPVATVIPVVTASLTTLAANAPSITINGFGFDPSPSNNILTFNDGAVGTITAASATALTVALTTRPQIAGDLTLAVSTDGVSNSGPVQVATMIPAITSNTANLPANATSITINGFGFDPIANNDIVVFNDGAVGIISTASTTALTVTFSAKPTTAGTLTATVATDTESSGAPVPIATVIPVITANTANLAANQSSMTISGFGFDSTASQNLVTFNDGAVGTVTAATATALVVSLSTKPTTAGSLTASVTTDTESNGTAVEVATVIPVVTASAATLPANAASITISGFGFDPAAGNNTVAFTDGAVGTVTAASSTSLTVTFSTKPSSAGSLTASVATDSESNGSPVQLATVIPVIASNSAGLAANAASITVDGFGFDPTPGNNTVTFTDGAVGTISAATATALTITFTTKPTTVGALNATITSDSESNGASVPVATVVPAVTANAADLPATATSMTISGVDFDSVASHNTVSFDDGAFGVVTAATATSLTVSFTGKPATAGSLTATITTDSETSAVVQVATVIPVVTANPATLAASTTSVTIDGFGFDPTAANNTVVFNDGAIGTVTAATATSLTIGFTTRPLTSGSLSAQVTTDNISNTGSVPVATIVPVIAASSATLAANAASITITGFGFDPTAGNNIVLFNDQAIGTVSAATATSVTVTFTKEPSNVGSLTAAVTTDSETSGVPVQVATVVPAITANAANLSASATGITIAGFDFDPIAGNDTVAFNDGAVGSVTAATATSLSVTFSTLPTTADVLTATVTADSASSGTPVAVATVVPVVTAGSIVLAPGSTSLTIAGVGFDSNAANDQVTLTNSNGVAIANSIGSATDGSLTLTLTGGPLTGGTLQAALTVDSIGSGTPVPVATVVPVVTAGSVVLAPSSTSLTIAGGGFDTNAANDQVILTDADGNAIANSISRVTADSLTVTLASGPLTAGTIESVVEVDGSSSNPAVSVATVTPVLNANTANLPANATTLIITGSGFDSHAANNTVTLTDVTTARATISATVLSVTNSQATLSIVSSGEQLGDTIDAVVTTDGVSSASEQAATVSPPLSLTASGSTILPVGATTLTISGTGFDTIAAHNLVALTDATTSAGTIAVTGVSVNAAGTQLTLTFVSSGLTGGDAIDAAVQTDGASSGPTLVATESTSPVDIVTSTVSLGGTSGLIVTLQPENSSGQDVTDGTLGSAIAFTDSGPSGGSFGPVTFNPSTGTYSATFTPPPDGGGPYVFDSTIDGYAVTTPTAPVTLAPSAAHSTLSLSASGILLGGSNPTSTEVTLQVKDQYGDTLDTSGLTAVFSDSSSHVAFQGTFALDSSTITVTSNPTGLVVGQGITGAGIPAGTTIDRIAVNGSVTTLQISSPTTASTSIGFNGTFAKGSKSIAVVGTASGLAAGVPISGPGIAAGTTITKVSVSGGKTTLAISKAATAASTNGTSGEALVASPSAALVASTGVFGPVIDNNNGTYSSVYTDTNLDDAVIAATLNGTPVNNTATVPVTFADTFPGTSLNAIWATEGGTLAVGSSFAGTFAANSTSILVAGSATGLIAGQTLAGPGIAAGTTITATSVSKSKTTTLTISEPTTAASTQGFNGTFAKGSKSIAVVGTGSGLAAGMPISGPGITAGTTISKVSVSGGITALAISKATTTASTGGSSGEVLAASAAALAAGNDAGAATGTDLAVLSHIAQANVTESLTLARLASGQTAQLVARYQGPTTSNYYAAGITNTGGKLYAQIYKNINGKLTSLGKVLVPAGLLAVAGTGASALASGTIRLDAIGPSLRLYAVNGSQSTLLLAVADSSITAAGSAGIRAIGNAEFSGYSVQAVNLQTPSLPYSDFLGASSQTADNQLGTNWLDETGDFAVRSGLAVGGAATSLAVLNGVSQANVSESVSLENLGVGQTAQLVARFQGTTAPSLYLAGIARSATGYTFSILKIVNGIQTTLATETLKYAQFNADGFAATSTIRFDVIGSSLRLYVVTGSGSRLVVAAADTGIVTPGSVGIRTIGSAALGNFTANTVALDTPNLPFTDFATSTPTSDGQLSLNWIGAAGDFVTNFAETPGEAVANNTGTNLALLNTTNGTSNLRMTVTVGGLQTSNAAAGLVAGYTGPGNANLYWGRILNMHGKFVAQIVKNVKGVLTVLASEPITAPSLSATGTAQLEFDVIATPGSSTSLALLVNGGSNVGGATVAVTDSSATASFTQPGNIGICGTTDTRFSNFSAP